MKKLFLGLLALLVLMMPVVWADSTSSASVTIAATWEGGVIFTVDKSSQSFPVMKFPADNVWYDAVGGKVTGFMTYSVTQGHKIRLAFSAAAWSPLMNTFGPPDTIRVVSVEGGTQPAGPAGAVVTIFTSGTDLGAPVNAPVDLNIQVRNVGAKPAAYTNSITFILSDVL